MDKKKVLDVEIKNKLISGKDNTKDMEIGKGMENKLFDILSDIKGDIIKIREDLRYHIKRTDLLEDVVNDHRNKENIHKKHISLSERVKKVTTYLVPISILLGIIITLQKLGII